MFYELKLKILEMFHTHKKLISLHFWHKFVYIRVSEHFSFAKIIHPPPTCVISRSSMIKRHDQVHLVLWTRKGHSKMCSFVTQHNAIDISSWGSVQLACWLQECPPELSPENWMFISLSYTTSNFVLENFVVCSTALITADDVQLLHMRDRQTRLMKLRSIYFWN